MGLQRYEWEDALIEAELAGQLSLGAVNMALRLAKAITWAKQGRGKPELRWKNQLACESVGVSRATYFRHRKPLFDAGFFKEERGNLVPVLPEKSHLESVEHQPEIKQAQDETTGSQVDNPYTVDIYTGDSFTVDIFTDTACAVADAPATAAFSKEEDFKELSIASFAEMGTTSSFELGGKPQSQHETDTPLATNGLDTVGASPSIARTATERRRRVPVPASAWDGEGW